MRTLGIVSVNRDPLARIGAPHAGGQANYVRQLMGRMAERGWRVVVFTSQFGRDEPETIVTDGIVVRRIALPPHRAEVSELDGKDVVALAEAYRARGEDCGLTSVLACYWQSVPAAEALARQSRCPVCVTFCSLEVWKCIAYGVPPNAERFEIERQAAARFDATIAKSPTERDVLIAHYGAPQEKLHVIPNGVDLERFFQRAPTSDVRCEAGTS